MKEQSTGRRSTSRKLYIKRTRRREGSIEVRLKSRDDADFKPQIEQSTRQESCVTQMIKRTRGRLKRTRLLDICISRKSHPVHGPESIVYEDSDVTEARFTGWTLICFGYPNSAKMRGTQAVNAPKAVESAREQGLAERQFPEFGKQIPTPTKLSCTPEHSLPRIQFPRQFCMTC